MHPEQLNLDFLRIQDLEHRLGDHFGDSTHHRRRPRRHLPVREAGVAPDQAVFHCGAALASVQL